MCSDEESRFTVLTAFMEAFLLLTLSQIGKMRATLLFFCCICLPSCKLPVLSIARKSIVEKPLNMHGLYYNKSNFQNFILYQNGIIKGDFSFAEKNMESLIWLHMNGVDNFKKLPYLWGVFEIKNNHITIEHWQSRSLEYGITKYSGEILNDTMLLLNHPVVGKDTFFFHYMPVKPDSTNKFIK